jgi:DNA polymerase-3 subunit alpha
MDSLIKPSDLFKKVKELGQSAVAVTDHGTLAGAWDCLKYSKEAGVKLIMGCEFYFVDDVTDTTNTARLRHLILLAKNHQGYKNLLLANKLANDNHIVAFKKVIPRIDWKILEQVQEGLICTTACCSGILSQLFSSRQGDKAKEQAKRLKGIFGPNLAIEIQANHLRTPTPNAYRDYSDQDSLNRSLVLLAKELDIKVVPTTDAHFLTPDQQEAHDVLLAIASGQTIKSNSRLKYTEDFCLKSRDEIVNFFARWQSLYGDPQLLCDNTLFFANMCEEPNWIDPKFSNPSGKELPEFPVHDQPDFQTFQAWLTTQPELASRPLDVSYLRYWADTKFDQRVPVGQEAQYRQRLQEEFDVIEYHGFSSYMLIVADYIDYCRKNSIPVGPGRGSVGGSLIAYLIGIHQADPIKYNLIFARFHNKEKTSFPDIDTDFAPSGREKVQEYIRRKYGDDRVAHVSNVNTMTPKVYARDIARVFEFGGDRKAAVMVGTKIADSIPSELKTLEEALEKSSLFRSFAESKDYGALKKFAEALGAKAKAWSTHAGGLVIGHRPLTEFIPLRKDKDGSIAIEYEKERAEANGLVKMDTLGLETLDIIRNTYELIRLGGKSPPPEVLNYDEYDAPTYDLISKGDTLCVFQLGGSSGTIDLCRKVKPKSIEDISIINSLARPSARDIREDFIATKDGKKPVQLLHPSLQRAFGSTYGFGLYEECLMYLAQDVAGWDLHEADRLRKLTKEKGKNPKKAAQWKKEFIEDAVKNKIPEKTATAIWDEVVDKFQGYGFNLSHSILYSLISYHTAYLKAHFPLEFLTANLMSEVNSNAKVAADNIAKIKDEIRRYKVKILPPDINQSDISYKIIDSNTLLTGLDSLKFIGKDAIPEIVAKRPFSSFEELLTKVDGKKVRAPSVLALAASGCLDSFGMPRKQMYLYAADYKKKLAVWVKRQKEKALEPPKKAKVKKGQLALEFEKPEVAPAPLPAPATFNYPWPEDRSEWTTAEKYAMEIYYIGEGLSGNLREAYPGFFDNRALDFSKLPLVYTEEFCKDNSDFFNQIPISAENGTIEAVIKNYFEFKVKKEESKIFGETMARIVLEDPYGNTISMTVFPKKLSHFQHRIKELGGKVKLEPGTAIHCSGYINWYEGEISILFDDLRKCAPSPPMPSDLKPRKVSMRITGGTRKKSKEIDPEEFLEELEDELVEEGLAECDTEEEDLLPSEEEEGVDRPDGFV